MAWLVWLTGGGEKLTGSTRVGGGRWKAAAVAPWEGGGFCWDVRRGEGWSGGTTGEVSSSPMDGHIIMIIMIKKVYQQFNC